MKNRSGILLLWSISILLVIFLIILFNPLITTVYGSLFDPPAPTEIVNNLPKTNDTATPDATFAAKNLMITPDKVYPSPTKIILLRTTDLSPELMNGEKYSVIITHADGTNEKYLIGPIPKGDFSLDIPKLILDKLNLRSDDKILTVGNPLGFVGMPTPPIPPTIPVEPTKTEEPVISTSYPSP
jgi:hypothetical protein